jgi:hypothetical protein
MFYMILSLMLGLSATRQQAGTTVDCAQNTPLAPFVATSCTATTKSSRQPGRCPSYSGPAAAQRTPPFARIGCNLSKDLRATSKVLGNSKRFISTFVPSILLIVLVNMDQLMVIWLQNEHTQRRDHLTCC